MKELGVFPIQKMLITHVHWDHMGAYEKIKKNNGEDFELLASENAVEKFKNTDAQNEVYGYDTQPILDDVTTLKEGDIIDLNELELEIVNLFGHTIDSIEIIDRKNKNIFTGDTILDRHDMNAFHCTYIPPYFNETELLKTFAKLPI